MADLTEKMREIIITHYDLGKITAIEKAKLGDTNKSFIVTCEKEGKETKYCARQYHYSKQEPEITYEHAFDLYFSGRVKGEVLSPLPIKTKKGTTWVRLEFEGSENYYTVFSFIQGLEPYGWEYNEVSETAFVSIVEAMAKFHIWAQGFVKPKGSGRMEPPLLEFIDTWSRTIPQWVDSMKGDSHRRKLYEYCVSQWDYIAEKIEFAKKEYLKYKDGLTQCIIHEDINPSNLMFDKDDHVSAIFDFDWVTDGVRIYDVAWLAFNLMSSWREDSFGEMPIEKTKRFLSVYNNKMKTLDGFPGVLTKEERLFFPSMIILGCVKINYDFISYMIDNPKGDTFKWYVYVWKFFNLIRFVDKHFDEFTKIALEA
jgi:Ser/Thr protein kinase RdoA (MazF antagonist)